MPHEHVAPCCVQSTQGEPACPHAVSSIPGRQVLPWQHPMQFWELQGMVQAPALQISFDAVQFAQAPPPAPQAESLVPATQVLPWQQPLHVCALHGGGVHAWLTQVSLSDVQS